ncbi:WRKY transcription factor SUSIBA2-like [Apium graveolens]|uniref:WRKY transcription factor SUSIBA2-like n=1 Tax=Apium graveolens TaxID=4045 RepID=UPI003D7BBED1
MDMQGEKFEECWKFDEFDGMCEGVGSDMIVVKNESDFVKVEEEQDVKPSIAERRAVKTGFDAHKIDEVRFRGVASPVCSPSGRSGYLTIPAGISPTALLDSPVMLPNSQAAHSSPTTGTYQSPSFNNESMMQSAAGAADKDGDCDVSSSLSFKLAGLPCISELADKPPLDFKCPAKYLRETATDSCTTGSTAYAVNLSEDIFNVKSTALKRSRRANSESDQMSLFSETANGVDTEVSRLLEGQQREAYPPLETLRTSEDGYNWRKYGQKQVKGSEYPRSYYKCTQQNCQVKKKVERSLDGQITEIIYKGAHNHPKPQPSRRAILGCQFSPSETSAGIESTAHSINVEGGAVWRNFQLGFKDAKPDGRPDGLERTSSTSVLTEISDIFSHTRGKSMGAFESSGTPELSSTFASQDGDDEDGATQGSVSLDEDAEDGESESKRRRKDSCIIETNLSSRTTREPRIVVQIESEIDVLDDGYRWRKYGQKVVKGNPNPRSYYKCTSAGCPVRKHVERASNNLKSVITTYEGKHTHEVPAARNSSQGNSVTASLPSDHASNSQPTVSLSRTANAPKPEPPVPDIALHFERNPAARNNYMRPYVVGNLGADMKFGAPSLYQVKLPPLPNSMSYGSYLMNPDHTDGPAACSVSSVLPGYPFSLPMTIPGSANINQSGVDYNTNGKPMDSVHPFLDGHLSQNDFKLVEPKVEKDDNLYGSSLPISDQANPASSSMFHQINGKFPS